jgi:putative PIN family toxin of toxin-antitoxin system
VAKRIKVVRAVLDTNIFLRSLIRRGNVSHKIIELWKTGHFLVAASESIQNEVEDVLKRPWLMAKYGYSHQEVDQLIDLISQKAIFVEPVFSLQLCRDVNDDKFVDCAVLGRVKFLVSQDNDLLADENLKKQLLEYGVEVLTALDFYQRLEQLIESEAAFLE